MTREEALQKMYPMAGTTKREELLDCLVSLGVISLNESKILIKDCEGFTRAVYISEAIRVLKSCGYTVE